MSRLQVPTAHLRDPQGRPLDYLRLAVTARCSLRCHYCRPAPVAGEDELSAEELLGIGRIAADLGIRKIRLTGGEPLLRHGLPDLVARLAALPGGPEILLTTNGLQLRDHLDALHAAGLRRINLSLDTLDAATFARLTGHDGHDRVLGAIEAVLAQGMGLKLNVVVLPGWNTHEVAGFVSLTRDRDLAVRFIEPMPFDGAGRPLPATITGVEILDLVQAHHALVPLADPFGAVERTYRVPGHRGTVGIIAGHSRHFCGECRRLRVDSRGRLLTCRYGRLEVDLAALLRGGATDAEVATAIGAAVARRLSDGHAAEGDRRRCGRGTVQPSLTGIGG